MNSITLKIAAVCTAIIIALSSVLSVCSVNVCALDHDYVRGGTVPVVLYLKDVYLVTYLPALKTELSRKFIANEFEWSSGSGFFVGNGKNNPQYIVTNNHVVEGYVNADEGGEYVELIDISTQNDVGIEYEVYKYIQASSCELRIYYSDDEYEKAYVECYGDSEKLDLAVMSIQEPTNKRHSLKIAPVSDSNVSETIYTVGYPGNANNEFSSASRLGINDSTIHQGTISRIVRNEGKGIERVSIDAIIQHGNSGGPLVNEKGYVLGVNTNVISNSPYAEQIEVDYYSISSNELMEFLDKNSIPYQKAGSNTPVIVIASVGGVIILAAAGIVLKKKVFVPKRSAAPADKKSVVPPIPSASVASVPSAAPSVPSVPSAQAASTKKAFIRSMSAQHNGKMFPVGKAPVVIGRDPSSCVIVFMDGTQGVSGVHCSVSYDSETDVFTLTDLGSTYGTYLIGGQQVLAQTSLSLRSGDSFYVGDKANVCRVEVVQ